MGTVSAIVGGIVTYGQPILSIFGAAAAAAAWLPQGKQGTLWGTVRPAIDWLGQNYGHAKNMRA